MGCYYERDESLKVTFFVPLVAVDWKNAGPQLTVSRNGIPRVNSTHTSALTNQAGCKHREVTTTKKKTIVTGRTT